MTTKQEFEPGEEVLDVDRRPRSGVVVSVRLSEQEAIHLSGIAAARRMTMSQVVRQAVSEFLNGVSVERLAAMPWAPWSGATTAHAPLQLIVPSSRPVLRTEGAPTESYQYTPA